MSSVKQSTSDCNLWRVPSEQCVEGRGLPHTLPGHTKPPVPPRTHAQVRKTQSCQQLPSEAYYSSPRQWLSHSRDRPIPLPRKKSLPPPSPDPQTSDYTELQPHWSFQPTRTPHLKPSHHHSPPLTLRELAQNPQHLPATIETIDGFYGLGQQFTISAGDKLYVHFVKQVKMAVLCDRSGTHFYVPLSSAMKFGLCQETLEFEKVSDLARKTRHIICSQQPIPCLGKQAAVEEGELLVVKEHHWRGLSCHSLRRDQDVFLHKNCRGSFTTSPEKTSVYLLDFLQYLPHLLPCKVHLYPPSEGKQDVFSRGRVFTLKGCTSVTSLVVSNVGASEDELFDVLLDESLSDLRVIVFGRAPPLSLSRKGSIMPGHYTKLVRSDDGLQKSLYTNLRRGYEGEGVNLTAGDSPATISRGGRVNRDYEYVDVLSVRAHYRAAEFGSPADQNRDYLKSLSMHEVCLLVREMGLEKYETAFLQGQVSGSLLAELNRHNLQSFLRIYEPSHQQKLLKVISGEISAKDFLFRKH